MCVGVVCEETHIQGGLVVLVPRVRGCQGLIYEIRWLNLV